MPVTPEDWARVLVDALSLTDAVLDVTIADTFHLPIEGSWIKAEDGKLALASRLARGNARAPPGG